MSQYCRFVLHTHGEHRSADGESDGKTGTDNDFTSAVGVELRFHCFPFHVSDRGGKFYIAGRVPPISKPDTEASQIPTQIPG